MEQNVRLGQEVAEGGRMGWQDAKCWQVLSRVLVMYAMHVQCNVMSIIYRQA